MVKNYGSIVDAFTAQALGEKSFPETDKVLNAVCNIYQEFDLDNGSLTLEWFSPANRKAVAHIVDSDVQEDILRAFDALATAQKRKTNGRDTIVVADHPSIIS